MVKRRRPFLFDLLVALAVLLIALANVVPIAWGIMASLKPVSQLVTYPPTLFDFTATLDNYRTVVQGGFMTGVRNSALYGVASVMLALSAASLAAFGICRFSFAGRDLLFLVVVASIPLAMGAAAVLIPKYVFFAQLGITNKWYTLPLIYAVHSLPIAIWILRGSMDSVPVELDEAAYVDGASSLKVLWMVILPLCRPALAAAAILVFLHAWNEFIAGSVMVDARHLKPIQPLLYQFIGFFGREWGPLTAAATVAILPILLIYAFFGRHMVSGLTRGATKG